MDCTNSNGNLYAGVNTNVFLVYFQMVVIMIGRQFNKLTQLKINFLGSQLILQWLY